MRLRLLATGAAIACALAGCGSNLSLSHSETPCITPGQVVTLNTQTAAGSQLSYDVQDDFGGEVGSKIAPVTTDSSGKATVTWQSPSRLSTTTLHFLLTAKNGDSRTNRDIHVVVGGNGRSC
ncbi:MAG TPA: hypothetical protein VNV65_03280 [Candidatus Solibacter sp.]|nr:hypothetical protein [Candidatus Solibacter sp.]